MKNKVRFLIWIILANAAFSVSAGGETLPPRQIVAGPFQSAGENALFRNHLAAGEQLLADVKMGDIAGKDSGREILWREANVEPDGAVDLSKICKTEKRAIVYAYTEIDSPENRFLAATFGSGSNIQVRLNGRIVFESRLSRKPANDRDTLVLPLHRGTNRILVKIEDRGNGCYFQWRTHRPESKVFVNRNNTIIPDFREGEAISGWGQIEVANASGDALKNVRIEAVGDGLIYPARSDSVSLKPAEVQRIPVRIKAKRAASGNEKPLRLRILSGGEEQIVEFEPRVRKADGYFVTTYRSAVDGSVQPFSVLLPNSFKPRQTYPLILLLHGAHVTDWGQNIISYEAKEWAIQVAVHGRGNNRYRDIGEVDIDEVLAEVKRLYRIDEDRIYLSGHSMGGYGTWFQAVRRPDMWASISPQAGYADYFLYHPAMSGGAPDSFQQDFQKRLLESWSPLLFAENLLQIPAYIVHGAKDDNVSVEHSRRMAARLKELGYEFVYDENPEGGHWWGPRGKNYGTEIVDKPAIWNFLRKKERRPRTPEKVIFKTDSLRYRKAYWVSVDELDRANEMAEIEAEKEAKNSVEVRLKNIRQFTLRLDEKLFDVNRKIKVRIGNRTVFDEKPPRSGKLTLRRAPDGGYLQIPDEKDPPIAKKGTARRSGATAVRPDESGKTTKIVSLETEPFKKSAELYGKISDAFNRPFLFVVGANENDKAMTEAIKRAAENIKREWMARADGIVKIKRDAKITGEDIDRYNLILFGNPQTNTLISRIGEKLPIRFTNKGLEAGGEIYSGRDVGTVFIHPNPLNKYRYTVVIGGTSPESMETAGRLILNELPDYVIFDGETLSGENTRFAGGGFFNTFWQIEK